MSNSDEHFSHSRMQSTSQPTAPRPEDFQITDVDVSKFEDFEERKKALLPKLSFGVAALGIAALGIIQTDWKWMFSDGLMSLSTYIGLIMLAVGWAFLTFVGGIPAAVFFYP